MFLSLKGLPLFTETTLTEYDTKESEVLKLLNSVNVAKREVEVVSGRSVAKATTIAMYLCILNVYIVIYKAISNNTCTGGGGRLKGNTQSRLWYLVCMSVCLFQRLGDTDFGERRKINKRKRTLLEGLLVCTL